MNYCRSGEYGSAEQTYNRPLLYEHKNTYTAQKAASPTLHWDTPLSSW